MPEFARNSSINVSHRSIIMLEGVIRPAADYLLARHVAPVYGAGFSSAFLRAVGFVTQAAWLLPAYVITLGVSCKAYQDIARQAHAVGLEQKATERRDAGGSGDKQGVLPRAFRLVVLDLA